MARTGRPRTPTKVLELRGTKRPDRHADRADEPQPGALTETPKPPVWLDATGRAEWARVATELRALSVLTTIDLGVLEGYCAAYARACKAERVLKTKGFTMKTLQGEIVRPEVAIARTSWGLVKQFAGELGLSPSARTRVRPAEKPTAPKANPFGEFAGRQSRGSGA